ncbi:MAG: winged helix-turn-helix transcriptional regulator [Cetobacterium sp.]
MSDCCNNKYILNGVEYKCSLNLAMDIIGGKWKLLILWHLNKGTLRFAELRRLLPGISKKVLTEALRELEDHQIVSRKIYPDIPPKVEYSITDLGKNLIPALKILAEWGEERSKSNKKK